LCSSESRYDSANDDWLLFGNTDSNFQPQFNSEAVSETEESGEKNISGSITGLHWIYNRGILKEPDEKMPMKKTTIKPGYEHIFKTPIEATLAMFPVGFWEIITMEINHFAEQKLQSKKGKKELIAGYKWKPVTLNNVVTYFGILMYAMLFPVTGHRMREAWDSPYQNAWTKFMSKGRYLQICSVLHFNDNSENEKLEMDSLHEIRPLLTN
jgi:hypothetical protein